MSLLEIIRHLLEYLGFPPDRLLQVLERKDYGWTRSIVRIIGTLLPLEQCPRPHFQPGLVPELLESRGTATVCRPEILSLAEAPVLLDDEPASCTRFRHNLPSPVGVFTFTRPTQQLSSWAPIVLSSAVSDGNRMALREDAVQKIAALEDELMQLRSQIAAIVAMQETKYMQSCSETMCLLASPCAALPPPSSTSTPINDRPLHATPIPPPPPPPPLLAIPFNSAKSAIHLIKERRAAHKQSPKKKEVAKNTSVDKLPSMMDVLKDMNSIRLRAVERSPGGTPLTRKDKRRSLNDPAAIIAHALKQKFAHRHSDESFDKENRSHEESPFSSPETPMFGRHLLKPIGMRTQKEIPRKQVFSKSSPHV